MTNWKDEPGELDLVYEDLKRVEDENRLLSHMNNVLVEQLADAIMALDDVRRLVKQWEHGSIEPVHKKGVGEAQADQ